MEQTFVPIVPKIKDFIYDKERSNFALRGEETTTFLIDLVPVEVDGKTKYRPKIEYVEGVGVLSYYKGVSFPAKGAQLPEAMKSLNQMKRLLRYTLQLCKNPIFLIGLYAVRKQAMDYFTKIEDRNIGDWSIKSEYMCRCAYAVETFLEAITGNSLFSHYVAQIPEYDDAYRYRAQDVFTSLDVEAFRANPRKELTRLVNLYISREREGVLTKTGAILRMANLLLYIPSLRKKVAENIHLLKVGVFDESDKYWVSITDNGYKYFGVDIDERVKLYEERPYAYKVTT